MTKTLLLLISFTLLTFTNLSAKEQPLYSQAYGKKSDPAMLFIHGGPGYNSVSFELSTAQALADKGFYVIVYDQRGGGRSAEMKKSKYTFAEAFSDINTILKKYKVKKTNIIGHSWGGTLALKYATKFPNKVDKVILADSPLAYQETFKTIIRKCRAKYTAEKSPNLQYIVMLENMDTTSLDYSSYCFMSAMQCGLYQPKVQSEGAKKIYQEMTNSPDAKYLSDMTREPVSGFYANEKYTALDMRIDIDKLAAKNKVFGIYGAEDGLFDEAQLGEFKNRIGGESFTIVQGASHNVFIDQHEKFIDLVARYMSSE